MSYNLFYCLQSDLLDLAAVRQLERDPKTAPVFRLLEIFLTSHLDAYLDFQSANAALLKSFGECRFCKAGAAYFLWNMDTGVHY